MSQGPTKGVPIDTDVTLAANSDALVPSQKAIKYYVDSLAGMSHCTTVTVNFGATFTDKATTTVTGLTWVGSGTCLVGMVITPTSTDTDEMYLLDFMVEISNIIVGTGFTVTVYSQPEAKGTYDVSIIGVG